MFTLERAVSARRAGRRVRALVFAGMLVLPAVAAAETLVSLDTRPGVTQRFLLIKPEKPVASVVLFAGGSGALNLGGAADSPAIGWGKNNFLVRTRQLFAERGFMVAVLDAPSDHSSKNGMRGGFRGSAEHCEDVAGVVKRLTREAAVPVWLVGTSRGTESAANCAIRLGQAVNGVVLTSSMTVPNAKGPYVLGMELDRIRVPAFVLAHRDDGCSHTPAADAPKILEKLSNAPRKELKVLSGGDAPRSKPCQALSAHGFLGIEQQAIDAIASFIRTGLAAAPAP